LHHLTTGNACTHDSAKPLPGPPAPRVQSRILHGAQCLGWGYGRGKVGTQKRPRRHGAPSRAPRDAQASRIGGGNAPRFPHPPAHPPHFCAILLVPQPCSLISPGAGQSLPCPPRRHKPSWPRSRLGLPQRAAYSECPLPLPPHPPPTTSLGSPLPVFRVSNLLVPC